MIVDTIKNMNLYTHLSSRIQIALNYIATTDFSDMEIGRYDIDGDNLFAFVQEYQTIPREQGKWECHQKYIDIQFITEGIEQIGFANIEKMEVLTEYNPAKDITFLKGEGDYATLAKGYYGIYFPHDVHQPKVAPDQVAGHVKKVVVKIKVD